MSLENAPSTDVWPLVCVLEDVSYITPNDLCITCVKGPHLELLTILFPNMTAQNPVMLESPGADKWMNRCCMGQKNASHLLP